MPVLRDPKDKTYSIESNEDGSVTFTREEFNELTGAFTSLYDILNDMPTYIGDFYDSRSDYLKVRKWIDMLVYIEYDPREYLAEEDEEDEEAEV